MSKPLTARFVETVKPPSGQRERFPDTVVEGLELRVGTTGRKTWSLRFRSAGGARNRMSLGHYPFVTLADARAKAIKALATLHDGHNPAHIQRSETIAAREDERTIGDLAAAFRASAEARQRADTTNAHNDLVWRKHLAPLIGKRAVRDVTRAEVRDLVQKIEKRSGPRTANFAQAFLRRIYNFAIREEWTERNPAQFPMLYKMRPRERVLSEAEVRLLWRQLDLASTGAGPGMSEPTAIALQLCLSTLQRAGEVSGLHTDELDWTTRSWLIPAQRCKNRRAHHVPLSQVSQLLILRALSRLTATPAPQDLAAPLPAAIAAYRGYLFPAADGIGPSDRRVVSRAMNRFCEKLCINDATPHDLRRTGASMMASERCNVRGDVISRLLNHTPLGPPVTQIYNRYDYAPEKRAALEAWSQTILMIAADPLGTRIDVAGARLSK